MEILSHRGMWNTPTEKNKISAFTRSFEHGFGCELDIRDHENKLAISHDIPQGNCLYLEEVLECYQKCNSQATIAINVKADGLQSHLKELLTKYYISNYFVFDMSIPDTLGYLGKDIKTFSRHSEYENNPAFYEKVDGIWLDCFNGEWWTKEELKQHFSQGKTVALVSPELHKRNYQETWDKWRSIFQEFPNNQNQLMLCTDLPQQAQEFFNV
jgi:hypothetical protein